MAGNEERRRISDERISKLLPIYYSGKYESTLQFLQEYGIATSVFHGYLKRNGLKSLQHTTRKFEIDVDYFKNIDTEEKAYWLGFLQCDGYITKTRMEIVLCYSDKEHIYKFLKETKSTYEPRKKIVANKYEAIRVDITSIEFLKPFVDIGIDKFTSINMKLLMTHDNPLFIHYIRGIIDANGHMYIRDVSTGFGFCLQISSGSIDFIKSLKRELELYCGHKNQVTIFKNNDGVNIRQICAKKILIDGYLKPKISLDRKQEKANAVLQRMCINL